MPPNPKPRLNERTSWCTYLYLDDPPSREQFLADFRALLRTKFERYIDAGGNKRYGCGQLHDRSNTGWKPFQHFERFCEQKGLDFLAARDFLEEHFGVKIICECQIMNNDREMRKKAIMQQFGTDFEGMELLD